MVKMKGEKVKSEKGRTSDRWEKKKEEEEENEK